MYKVSVNVTKWPSLKHKHGANLTELNLLQQLQGKRSYKCFFFTLNMGMHWCLYHCSVIMKIQKRINQARHYTYFYIWSSVKKWLQKSTHSKKFRSKINTACMYLNINFCFQKLNSFTDTTPFIKLWLVWFLAAQIHLPLNIYKFHHK